jgi:hypothetical protein
MKLKSSVLNEQQWIEHVSETFALCDIRAVIDHDIKHGLANIAWADTIALVRRLRSLGALKSAS